MTSVGTWVKRQRLKRKLSQAELGIALGKSRTWVSSLERGTFRPRVEDCGALGAYFDVELGEVLSLAGYPLSEIANLQTLRAGGANIVRATSDGLSHSDSAEVMPAWAQRLLSQMAELSAKLDLMAAAVEGIERGRAEAEAAIREAAAARPSGGGHAARAPRPRRGTRP